MKAISPQQAFDCLASGQPINSLTIIGLLEIETDDVWNEPVTIENCTVEAFSCVMVQFGKPVKLFNCHFKKCNFIFSYFFGGLIIEDCVFDDYLDFSSGGHNKMGMPVSIANNTFKGFVNFFDCIYDGEVTIANNIFIKNTNLLASPHNIPVSYEVPPIIKENMGLLDMNDDGSNLL